MQRKAFIFGGGIMLIAALLISISVLSAQDNWTVTRVSVSGEQADNESYFPSISADGQVISFESGASNLISGGHQRR